MTIAIATFAADQVSEVLLDDISLINLLQSPGTPDGPAIRAESLASTSKWVNIASGNVSDFSERVRPYVLVWDPGHWLW